MFSMRGIIRVGTLTLPLKVRQPGHWWRLKVCVSSLLGDGKSLFLFYKLQ
jgi:hypothetical protein